MKNNDLVRSDCFTMDKTVAAGLIYRDISPDLREVDWRLRPMLE